jgi:hypothetical protein
LWILPFRQDFLKNDEHVLILKPVVQMMEIAGVQVPVRLRQQLEEERAQRNMPQTVVQDAPRLTHKLLRVQQLSFLSGASCHE